MNLHFVMEMYVLSLGGLRCGVIGHGWLGFLQEATELYGFLFRHYEEREFWWEMSILTRKMVFAIIVNMPRSPEQQAMLSIMCLLPYIVYTYRRRPYSHVWLNTMDLVGASMAAGLAFAGLVMFGGYYTALPERSVRPSARQRAWSCSRSSSRSD